MIPGRSRKSSKAASFCASTPSCSYSAWREPFLFIVCDGVELVDTELEDISEGGWESVDDGESGRGGGEEEGESGLSERGR